MRLIPKKITPRRLLRFATLNAAVATMMHFLPSFAMSGRSLAIYIATMVSTCVYIYLFADPIE